MGKQAHNTGVAEMSGRRLGVSLAVRLQKKHGIRCSGIHATSAGVWCLDEKYSKQLRKGAVDQGLRMWQQVVRTFTQQQLIRRLDRWLPR